MGLFGKLFEKKECAICGDEIGLFGEPKARRRQHVQSVRGEALPMVRRTSPLHRQPDRRSARIPRGEQDGSRRVPHDALARRGRQSADRRERRRFMVTSARNLADANPDVPQAVRHHRMHVRHRRGRRRDHATRRRRRARKLQPALFQLTPTISSSPYPSTTPISDEMRFKLNNRRVEVEEHRSIGPPCRSRWRQHRHRRARKRKLGRVRSRGQRRIPRISLPVRADHLDASAKPPKRTRRHRRRFSAQDRRHLPVLRSDHRAHGDEPLRILRRSPSARRDRRKEPNMGLIKAAAESASGFWPISGKTTSTARPCPPTSWPSRASSERRAGRATEKAATTSSRTDR